MGEHQPSVFSTDLTAFELYCQDLGPIFSQYGPHVWLIRYMYCYFLLVLQDVVPVTPSIFIRLPLKFAVPINYFILWGGEALSEQSVFPKNITQ